MTTSYEVGFARADITVFEPDMAMLGWGMFYNRTEGVAEPIYARAMVVRDQTGGRFAYVCADLLLMSQAVRFGVMDTLSRDYPELGLDEARVMLTATHTHSAPAGYSHYFWINIGGPGFSRRVLDVVVKGIVEAIVAAEGARRPGRLSLQTGEVPPSAGIAFNRSWFAYSRNHDVAPVDYEHRAEAVDATMKVLRFDPDPDPDPGSHSGGQAHGADNGQGGGMVSWFPLHGTCVHSENRKLHPDHKGLACGAFESRAGVFGIFAQEATGDVTPNHRLDKERGLVVGRFDSDYDNAAWVAGVEAEHAHRIYSQGDAGPDTAADHDGAVAGGRGLPIEGPVAAAIRYVDFNAAPIDPRFAVAPGAPATTRPARIGVSMALGTAEGPGPLYPVPWVARLANGAVRALDAVQGMRGAARHYDPQWPMLELARGLNGRLMGLLNMRASMILPVDPIFRYVQSLIKDGALDSTPWVPHIVPIQIVCLGPLAIAAVPFEPSTVAGRRLRATLLEALAPAGVEEVVLNPYANAYAGYLTTFEEYQVQHYEAGYTIFGPWQLAAARTAFASLAADLTHGDASKDLGPSPDRIPDDFIERQAYTKPWPAYGSPT